MQPDKRVSSITHNCRLTCIVMIALLTAPSGCVSHRYVVRVPERVVGNWGRVEEASPGTEIDVLRTDGNAARGLLLRSEADAVVIIDPSGREVLVRKDEVREIRETRADSLAEGAVLGGVLGTAGGFASRAEGGNDAFWATFGWTLGLGVLIDALIAHHEVLYRAP